MLMILKGLPGVTQKFKSLLTGVLMTGILFGAGNYAFAQMESSILFVAPHRLVIDPSEKVEVLNVANKSEETHRYDLTLIDQVMNENGMTLRKDTFDYSAKRMIRFVPKRFTLKPGERQVVRVMVKRPDDMTDGDYHSHLLFREVPLSVQDKQTLKAERAEQNNDKKVSFEIRALYGVAVPIVVQQGKIESDMAMGDASIVPATDKEPAALSISFNRTGNSEAAAQISASFVKDGTTEAVQLIEPVWIRIYREVSGVTRKIPLKDLPAGIKLSGGKLVLTLDKKESDTVKPLTEGTTPETKTETEKGTETNAEAENSVTKEIPLP